MSTHSLRSPWRRGGLGLLAALALALPAAAQPAASGKGKVPVPEDLFAVITLRGKPCGGVKEYQRLGETDYRVTCKDGHHYRVYVAPDGRVVVEDQR